MHTLSLTLTHVSMLIYIYIMYSHTHVPLPHTGLAGHREGHSSLPQEYVRGDRPLVCALYHCQRPGIQKETEDLHLRVEWRYVCSMRSIRSAPCVCRERSVTDGKLASSPGFVFFVVLLPVLSAVCCLLGFLFVVLCYVLC